MIINVCYTHFMEFNPHSLHQILTRIRDQMRCPQCGTRVAVDFPSIKLASDDFILLQLKCESCTAFIVLHVNVTDSRQPNEADLKNMMNVSSTLHLSEEEIGALRKGLADSDGSFENLFRKVDKMRKDDMKRQHSAGDGPSAFV